MSQYIHSLKNAMMRNDGHRVAAIMQVLAWISLIAGIFVSFYHGSDFSDQNLGLMVGIGMVIAGMQIFGVGTFVHLLHSKEENDRRNG
ncbi:hypothetical protein [Brevibacillus fulvus]|uniref:Membrane protein YedE/YeeE n=1 Tax=Brevibacillus fulvus TaxID=1125967 RepID=A0A939BPC9_9BACL|nr:hypothetical protein [Brevibacillus fulvus]MBM7590325.1 putative membrane protein YedE/YeeE [Brevibacillus fulvus]